MECVRKRQVVLSEKGLMAYILSAKGYDLRKFHGLKGQKGITGNMPERQGKNRLCRNSRSLRGHGFDGSVIMLVMLK